MADENGKTVDGQEDDNLDNLDNQDKDTGDKGGDDGKPTVKPEDQYKDWVSPEEAERMRNALKQANKEAQTRRERLNQYEELGLDDLEKAKEILKERDDAELKRAEEERNFTEWQEKIKGRYEGQLNEFSEKVEKTQEAANKYKSQLENYLVDNEALRVLKELDGEPQFILPHLKNEVKVVEDDKGEMSTQIIDKYGEPRFKDGKPMTIKDRVSEMREDDVFGKAFAAPKISGSGSQSGKGEGAKSAPKGFYRNEMSVQEKTDYMKEYGIEALNKLPRARPNSGKKS